MRETHLKKFEIKPTLENDMRSLALSLLTLVPPLRMNYHDMRVWREKKEPPKGAFNYIWEYTAGKWKYVIGNDKNTAKELKKAGYERVTDGARLNKIITKSFEVHPREYLMTPTRKLNPNEPMPAASYNSVLFSIFKPKKPTCNLFRKAYVNYHYPKLSTAQQRMIATRMRHSKAIALEAYRKINIPEECNKKSKSKKIVKDVDIELEGRDLPPPPVKEPVAKASYFNAKEHAKKYRVVNKDKIAAQRKLYYSENRDKILKDKILWHLNVSQSVDKPSKASVEKYGIKYNPEQKKWE